MRIANSVRGTVHIQGRGSVRLLDVMEEVGVSYEEVGFPGRIYRDMGTVALVCRKQAKSYELIKIFLGGRSATAEPDIEPPRVVSREPIPYVEVFAELYHYESGKLHPWSSRRKKRPPEWPKGFKVLQVLGHGTDPAYLRVRLPHKDQEWLIPEKDLQWLDRFPTKVELRLQEIWLDNPFDVKDRHPLWGADHLLEHARKERWWLDQDSNPWASMACEEWEEMREDAELSVDEAIIAIQNGLISSIENYGRTYYSGPFAGEAVERYIKAGWFHREETPEFFRQMADLHTIEVEMLRGAMRAVAQTRRLYARDAFERLTR